MRINSTEPNVHGGVIVEDAYIVKCLNCFKHEMNNIKFKLLGWYL